MKQVCTGCEIEKPIKDFNKNGVHKSKKRNGEIRYKTKCKRCEADVKSSLNTFIRNKYSKIQARYKKTKREEVRCDMTIEEFVIEVNDQLQFTAFTCPITDLPLTHKQHKKYKLTNLSIDRIDPNIGYTRDNMMVVSWLWNAMKSNNELKYMIRFCILLKGWQPKLYKKLHLQAYDMFYNQSIKSRKFKKIMEEFEKDKIEDKSVSQLLQEGFEREQNQME